jgi:predicted PurR-regulated permease PerM
MVDQQGQDTGSRVLLVIASLVIVIAGLKASAGLLLPFLISIFLAMVSLPLLNWLKSMRIPNWLAVLVTIIVALGVLVAVAVLVGGSIQEFTREAPKYRARLAQMYEHLLEWSEAQGIPVPPGIASELFNPTYAMDMLTGTLRGVAAVLSNLLLVFFTIVFILAEAAGFPAKVQAAFGWGEGSDRLNKILQEVQRFLAIKSVVSLVTGVLVGTSLWLIGVDFPMLWGGLAFLLNYIPTLGSFLAAIPPALLALLQLGPGYALVVVLVFLVINIPMGNLVEPYFMGRRLGISTLVVFLSLVFWGWVWGPVGMLLSVPLTMILKILLENTEDLRWIAVFIGPSPRGEPAGEADETGSAG